MKNLFVSTLLFVSLTSLVLSQSPYTNILISSSGGPEEPSICINPKNTNLLVAGANISFYYYSSNGGNSWSGGNLVSSQYGVWGDPIIACDTVGSFYFFHLSNPPSGVGHWIDRIVCQKSTNNGVSWNNPGSYMGFNNSNPNAAQDKHGIAVDWTHGPRGNWIYSTWTEFDVYGTSNPADSSKIMFSRSTDGGNSWSTALRISRMGGNCVDGDFTTEGAVPCVGPNGEVYVAWAGPYSVNKFVIFFDKSTDGGLSWLPDDKVISSQRGGWDYDISGINRCNGLPCTLCDISNGPYRGNIYVNYTDEAGPGDHDVRIIKSTNGGLDWGGPIRVNNDPPTKEQFFTWMAIDQATGFLYCVFYDRRNYTDNNTDVYMARSTDGGDTWTNERISTSPFNPTSGTFFGDYNGITAANGIVRPIWTRLVSGSLSVWTAIIDFPLGVDPMNTEIPTAFVLHQNYPNPFNPTTKIRFEIPVQAAGDVSLRVFDLLGRETATLVNGHLSAGTYEINWDAADHASGLYFYTLKAGTFIETKKMVITK
jgi:hypothetical protein